MYWSSFYFTQLFFRNIMILFFFWCKNFVPLCGEFVSITLCFRSLYPDGFPLDFLYYIVLCFFVAVVFCCFCCFFLLYYCNCRDRDLLFPHTALPKWDTSADWLSADTSPVFMTSSRTSTLWQHSSPFVYRKSDFFKWRSRISRISHPLRKSWSYR